MTVTVAHDCPAIVKASCAPWPPRHCEACGACEATTGRVYAGCLRDGETGGGWHAGHGPEGPTGAMRGPTLCWPCFQAWRDRMFPKQEGLGL